MKRKMTDDDLTKARPIAEKIIADMVALENPPMAIAALACALAGVAVLGEGGPFAPLTLYRVFYRQLAIGIDRKDLLGDVELRERTQAVLHNSGLLTLANFASLPLEDRTRILDDIITTANGLRTEVAPNA